MRIVLISMIALVTSFSGSAQKFNLKVVIEDIEKNKGIIYMSLHDKADGFPSDEKKAVRTAQVKDFGSEAEFTFENLDQGEYAVSVFQDLNGNAELDTNFFGFPQEPVGASNMTSLGRPNFSKCKFKLDKNSTIRVQYMN